MLTSLLSNTTFALFIIIAIGFVVGRISIKGINLDVSAVIFVALLFGHYGVQIPKALGDFGMVLFIFSIGMQAGPGFFSSFKSKGKALSLLASILIISAAGTTIIMSYIYGFNAAEATGLLTGSLTSTPGLATAKEVAGNSAGIAYGIAYPFGVIGVILFVKLLPVILKTDLKKEQLKLDEATRTQYPRVEAAAFEITKPESCGRTLVELSVRAVTGATISRIVRDKHSLIPKGEDCLQMGDNIKAVGTAEALEKLETMVGRRLEGELPFINNIVLETALLTTKALVGRPLASLQLQSAFGCSVTRIRRAGLDLAPDPMLKLRFGDKITLVGPQDSMQEAMNLLGNQKNKISDTDFFPIALGIVLGVILGSIPLGIGSFSFKFGLTGGVLMAALMLSSMGKTGSILWTMSSSANQLLRQLGLLLFLANVGTDAGGSFIETFKTSGASMFLSGVVITLFPMLITTICARIFMRTNILQLLGTLTGGMTSTPGLAAADSMCNSTSVSVAYATVYPVAMVLLIVMTQFVSILV